MDQCQDEIDKKIEPGLQAAYDAIGFGAMTKIAAAFGLTRETMRPDLYR
jgi:hypothetical protein